MGPFAESRERKIGVRLFANGLVCKRCSVGGSGLGAESDPCSLCFFLPFLPLGSIGPWALCQVGMGVPARATVCNSEALLAWCIQQLHHSPVFCATRVALRTSKWRKLAPLFYSIQVSIIMCSARQRLWSFPSPST